MRPTDTFCADAPQTPQPDRLTEIRTRLEKATPGPWEQKVHRYSTYYNAKVLIEPSVAAVFESNANSDLIAHAPEDIAYLLSEVTRLRGLVQEVAQSGVASRTVLLPEGQVGGGAAMTPLDTDGNSSDLVAEVTAWLDRYDYANSHDDTDSLLIDLRDIGRWLRALVQRTQARGYVNVLTLAPDGRRLGTRIENR